MLQAVAPGKSVSLGFERACNADECDVSGIDLSGMEGSARGESEVGDDFDGRAEAISTMETASVDAAASVEQGGVAAKPATASLAFAAPAAPAAIEPSSTSATVAVGSIAPIVVDAGVAESIGRRTKQEDQHVLTSFTTAPRSDAPPATFVLGAVFDGHRGGAASAHAAKVLPQAVRAAIERAEPAPLAAAWRTVCESYLALGLQDGSTATAALVSNDGRCELLNCGDSRAVLAAEADGGSCLVDFATRDHSPADEREMQRIEGGGGRVGCMAGGDWRVAVESAEGRFQVAVARALGGTEWQAGGIINSADVTSLVLNENHRFLILASDGIWGPLDTPSGCTAAERSEWAIWQTAAAWASGRSAGEIAADFVRLAERAGGTDNASCLVLALRAPPENGGRA